jgi:hypothetical protein
MLVTLVVAGLAHLGYSLLWEHGVFQQHGFGEDRGWDYMGNNGYHGNPATAAMAGPPPKPMLRSVQVVTSFVPYYNYRGGLTVSGHMTVLGWGSSDQAHQLLGWFLEGTDPACDGQAKHPPDGACSIQIHTGTGCFDHAGDAMWNHAHPNPWSKVRYITGGGGARAGNVKVMTGLTNDRILGQTMIVTDSWGERIACGIIVPKIEEVIAFSPYYNYRGPLRVTGWATVIGDGAELAATQTLIWTLQGVDTACRGAMSSWRGGDSCGIQLHQGTDCSADAGPHFFAVHEDPWRSVRYSENGAGVSHQQVTVRTGLTNSDVLGHTLIVHDRHGTKVACGVVVPKVLLVTEFIPYFRYNGPHKVHGNLTAQAYGAGHAAGQTLSWSLFNADPACHGAVAHRPMACGILIHRGTTCTGDAGEPFAKAGINPTTLAATYLMTGQTSHARGTNVATGLTNDKILGHVVVVYDSKGVRIACGVLTYGLAPPGPLTSTVV